MPNTLTQHFVTFYSPGTLFAEATTKLVESWDVDAAVKMAKRIKERYDARPYGFRFSTRTRGPKDLDSHQSARSPMYYLGGVVETLDDVKRRNDPTERILRANMEGNGWDRIVRNDPKAKNWAWTQPLEKDDVVLAHG